MSSAYSNMKSFKKKFAYFRVPVFDLVFVCSLALNLVEKKNDDGRVKILEIKEVRDFHPDGLQYNTEKLDISEFTMTQDLIFL